MRPSSPPTKRSILCLPGGGIAGGLFQIAALSAFEDHTGGFCANDFDGYVGVGAGALVAVALASGLPVQRLYRALLDPTDDFFPLHRSHLLSVDLSSWSKTIPHLSFEKLPWGLFSLEKFQRFIEVFFEKRNIPPTFRALRKPVLIAAHRLHTGELCTFGDLTDESPSIPIARAIAASAAIPLLFAPVRIDNHYYFSSASAGLVSLAIDRLTAQRLVVACPHGLLQSTESSSIVSVVEASLAIVERRGLLDDLAHVKAHNPDIDVTFMQPPRFIPSHLLTLLSTPKERREVLEQSYRAVRTQLDEEKTCP